jgi:hypothetical protein
MNKKYDNKNIIIASRAYFLHGDGEDEGAGGEDDGDDDPDEVQRDDDDDDDNGDDLSSPGRNFLSRFLPAGELFSLWCFLPRRGGGVYL